MFQLFICSHRTNISRTRTCRKHIEIFFIYIRTKITHELTAAMFHLFNDMPTEREIIERKMKYLLHLMQFTFKINKQTKRAEEFENQKCIANSVYCRSVSVIESIWFIFFLLLSSLFS